MQLQPYPMPMWQYIRPCYPHRYSANDPYRQSPELARLRNEKEVLEQGLADCVVYLQALRKKNARNERQLERVATLPRKKQKQLRQIKRNLEKDIENRERDEKAFLFNLQACRANIYASDILTGCDLFSTAWIDPAATPTVCTPTLCSSSYTETLDGSWNGWRDEMASSPSQRSNSNSSYLENIPSLKDLYRSEHGSPAAPDTGITLRLSPSTEDLVSLPLVPPNTARTAILHAELDPEACDFEPGSAYSHADTRGRRQSMLATVCSNPMSGRRSTHASIDPLYVKAGHELQPLSVHTWCTTTPQHSPTKDAQAPQRTRPRANSL